MDLLAAVSILGHNLLNQPQYPALICQGIVVLTLQIATIRSQLGRVLDPQDPAQSCAFAAQYLPAACPQSIPLFWVINNRSFGS